MAAVTIPFAPVGDFGFVVGPANLASVAVFVIVNVSLPTLRYAGEPRDDGYRTPPNVGRFSTTAPVGPVSSLGPFTFYLLPFLF